jgi:hypothetical protein
MKNIFRLVTIPTSCSSRLPDESNVNKLKLGVWISQAMNYFQEGGGVLDRFSHESWNLSDQKGHPLL